MEYKDQIKALGEERDALHQENKNFQKTISFKEKQI